MNNSLEPVFEFLAQLKNNNNREWFNDHKKLYEVAHLQMIDFSEALLSEMRKFDHIETVSGRKSLFRIYRDVRFSKDKRPYKTGWSGSFRRATNSLRGGYYFHIEPENTYIMGGFFGPNTNDLKHIRNHITQDDSQIRKVLQSKTTISYFGQLMGEQVKTAPKGFSKDHRSIDLLRYKQFMLKHSFTDAEAQEKDFYRKMALGFKNYLPFFGVMSEILTTDLNGISLI